MRLNRFLAQCGIASRRKADELILAGKVVINGHIIRDLGTRIDPENDRVEVAGHAVTLPRAGHAYWMLNKPEGYDVTRRDPHSEQTIFDLLPKDAPRALQPVGRLDRPTTGLLLLTDDGELAHRLTHPSYGIEKEYLAYGSERAIKSQIASLLRGVELDDGPAKAVAVEELQPPRGGRQPSGFHRGPRLKIVMHEGRKRIVRRLCAAVGYPLQALHRSRVGPLKLGSLHEGESRTLTTHEVTLLRRAAGLES